MSLLGCRDSLPYGPGEIPGFIDQHAAESSTLASVIRTLGPKMQSDPATWSAPLKNGEAIATAPSISSFHGLIIVALTV